VHADRHARGDDGLFRSASPSSAHLARTGARRRYGCVPVPPGAVRHGVELGAETAGRIRGSLARRPGLTPPTTRNVEGPPLIGDEWCAQAGSDGSIHGERSVSDGWGTVGRRTARARLPPTVAA